jgi:hypothetical protein
VTSRAPPEPAVPFPSKCTPEVVAAVVAALADHTKPTPLRDALRAGRVHWTSYYDWREKAARDEQPFADAVHRIEEARRAHLAHWTEQLATLAESGTKNDATRLRALTFLIEKLGGEAWNPPTRAEVSGPDGKPIAHSVTVEPAALAAKINDLAARRAARGAADGAGGGPGGAEPRGAGGDRR